jgi:hypothetical protein
VVSSRWCTAAELAAFVITLDTSAIIALLDRKDPDHESVAAPMRLETPPYLIPAAVLGEVGYFIEARLGRTVL